MVIAALAVSKAKAVKAGFTTYSCVVSLIVYVITLATLTLCDTVLSAIVTDGSVTD